MRAWLFTAIARLKALFTRRQLDLDLGEEFETHFEMLQEEKMRKGLTPREAARAARLELGGLTQLREAHREARELPFLANVLQDARYGARQLRRNPLFALTAGLTLAIGIGANTAIFTFANALLFHSPAGVADPGRLVDIGASVNGVGFQATSYPNYDDIRRRVTSLTGVYAHPRSPEAMSLQGDGPGAGADRVYAAEVSPNYFAVLGAVPRAGRLLVPGDGAQSNTVPPVVLSYRYWAIRWNRDPAAIGRTLRLNGRPYNVVGVATEGFQGTGIRDTDVWIPLHADSNRSAGWLLLGGRLKPGVSRGQAAAEMEEIGRLLERDYPEENRNKGLRLLPLSPLPGEAGPVSGFLAALMGLVTMVLLIACANVSGVLLSRSAARRREIAVRLAIGAGRGRILRQLLTETALLFLIGAGAGLALARVLTAVLVSELPALPFPIGLSLAIDFRVVLFAVTLSLIAALLSGIAPALQASKGDLVSGLKENARRVLGRSRFRSALVVAQVGLSLLLIVIAGLFIHSLQQVTSGDPAFDPKGVELAAVDLRMGGYNADTGPLFARQLLEKVRRLPDVTSATIAAVLPGGFEGIGLGGLSVRGITPPNGDPLFYPVWNTVEPGYFSTLRIHLLAGRDFNGGDRSGSQPVVILGETAAKTFWPGQSPVGKYVDLHPGPEPVKTLLVVGVARDPKIGSLVDGTTGLYAYLPLQQKYVEGWTTIVARSGSGRPLIGEIRALLDSMTPRLPIKEAMRAQDYAAIGFLPQRLVAAIAGGLGAAGMLLAGIGIYGVMAYMVARRRREFGIRIALGASRVTVLGMVLRQGFSLLAAGAVIGLSLSGAIARLLGGLLYGMPPFDYVVFFAAVALLIMTGLAACYLPARSATRTDPMKVLRDE